MSAGWAAFGSVEGGETRERGCPKSREDAPEHKSASDFPLPVGDSNSAFSPLSNAFRTFPMTPCAMRRRGETRRRRGGDEGRGRRERRRSDEARVHRIEHVVVVARSSHQLRRVRLEREPDVVSADLHVHARGGGRVFLARARHDSPTRDRIARRPRRRTDDLGTDERRPRSFTSRTPRRRSARAS